jgi:hypothetical protein
MYCVLGALFVCCLPFFVIIDEEPAPEVGTLTGHFVGRFYTSIRQFSISGYLLRTTQKCSKAITYDRIFIVHAVSYAAFCWYLLWHLNEVQCTTPIYQCTVIAQDVPQSTVVLAMVYVFVGFCALVWSFGKKLDACHRMQNEALARVHQKLKACQHELSLAVRQCKCSPSCAVTAHRRCSGTVDGLSGVLHCSDVTMCAAGQLRP